MAVSPRTRRSLLVALLVAQAVVAASAGVALVRGAVDPPARAVPTGDGAVDAVIRRAPVIRLASAGSLDTLLELARERSSVARTAAPRVAWTSRATATTPEPRAAAAPKATPKSTPKAKAGSTAVARTERFSGRNRVWFPALGIRRSVSFFSCSSSAYPGDRVYRWGCAGRNNVYLFGHASSVFRPLHDAYVRGRLKKGMTLYYADGAGRVSRYRIAWWKVTTPTRGDWAFAAQSRPSLTLQTCVGARSQYRLIVRLVRS